MTHATKSPSARILLECEAVVSQLGDQVSVSVRAGDNWSSTTFTPSPDMERELIMKAIAAHCAAELDRIGE